MEIKAKILQSYSTNQKNGILTEINNLLSDSDFDFFEKYVNPYENFSFDELDNIYLIAEITIHGNGIVQKLIPDCFYSYNEVGKLYFNTKLILPIVPFEVQNELTFLAVLESEGNLIDIAKDLPDEIWDKGVFDLGLNMTMLINETNIHSETNNLIKIIK